jgi:hypothetical protein
MFKLLNFLMMHLLKFLKVAIKKCFFFEKSIQNGFEKGNFNKFFNNQNIKIYKPR